MTKNISFLTNSLKMLKYVVLLSVICVVNAQAPLKPYFPIFKPTRPTTTTMATETDTDLPLYFYENDPSKYDDNCNPMQVNGVFFDSHIRNKTIVYDGVTRITQMVFNIKRHTLYLICGDDWDRRAASINFVEKTSKIYEIENPTCVAVNQWTGRVYVGTSDGIYLVDGFITDRPQRIPLRGNSDTQISVQSMYLEEHAFYGGSNVQVIYYTDSMNKLWTFENGFCNVHGDFVGVPAEQIVYYEDNIFFTQDKSLFRMKLGETRVFSYERYKGMVDILTADANNKPIITTYDGVYVLDKTKSKNFTDQYLTFTMVSAIKDLKALTFNGAAEPIYATDDELVYLKNQGCHFPSFSLVNH